MQTIALDLLDVFFILFLGGQCTYYRIEVAFDKLRSGMLDYKLYTEIQEAN